jgi:membrane-associated phospholipid phosphatase
LIRTGFWGAGLLGVFLLLGYLVDDSHWVVDTAVSDALAGFWQSDTGSVVAVLTDVLGPILPLIMLVLLIAAMIGFRQDAWRINLLLRAIVLLAACRAVSLFKDVFDRQRPREYPDYAYPSGHVVSVASVAFTSIVLCAWLAAHLLRRVLVISVVLVVLAAACRVLLDVHWVTDVLGGTLGVTGIGLLVAAALRLLPVGERRVSG